MQQTVRVWKVPSLGSSSCLIYKNTIIASVASLHSWWDSNLIPRASHLQFLGTSQICLVGEWFSVLEVSFYSVMGWSYPWGDSQVVEIQLLDSSPSHTTLPLVAVFRVVKYCNKKLSIKYHIISLFFQITEHWFDPGIIRILMLATFDNLTVVTMYST